MDVERRKNIKKYANIFYDFQKEKENIILLSNRLIQSTKPTDDV